MRTIYTCLQEANDYRLLLLAALICTVGVYASSALARHAARSEGRSRNVWAVVAIVSAGCTAWATHMIALLAFRPGIPSGFDPVLTALSLLLAIVGIGAGIALSVGQRVRWRRFLAGGVLGFGVMLLHYVGQASYLVVGDAAWNLRIVVPSIGASLLMFGFAMVVAGERQRGVRRLGAPLLLASIAVLHLAGMSALQLTFDPRRPLPDYAVPPGLMAPVVATVCIGLVVLAVMGLRFTLNARAQARRDQERLRELANLAVEGLAVCDHDVIVTANDSLVRLSGFDKTQLAGRRLLSLLPSRQIADLPEREERDAELLGRDGQLVPVRVLWNEVKLGNKRQTVVAIRDQRERLRSEERIRTLAFSDSLTGLANRSRFNEILAFQVAAAKEHGRTFALLMLDLDRFKPINDTLGHRMGDELLRRVGKRLSEVVRGEDLVARLGGDEFAVIVETVADAAACGDVARKIIENLKRPFRIEGHVLEISVSIGIALGPADGAGAEELSRHADLALYRAKEESGNTHRFFEPDMNARAQARRALEMDLRQAVAREEFEVYYQPQIDPLTGRFEGAEALVRWRHRERGMVSPADFIPLAEEIGLIGAIGEWVLRTACFEAAGWPAGISIAVNLSPLQLRDRRLPFVVTAILAETGLAGARLELEITEGALLQDDEVTYANLHALRALGVRISMDDFGTGYSSLSYLRRFPFDKIKIDQSFVRQIPGDADSVAIVQAIVSLGAKLRMNITVEGVETPEQRAFAVAEGCDQIQGYLVSRPVPRNEIRELLRGAEAPRGTAVA